MTTPTPKGLTDEELEALLDDLESDLREDVQAALTLTAQDFAAAVDRSTELVAAAFSVSRIGAMWRRRVVGLVTSIRRIARRGARVTADDLDEQIPSNSELSRSLDPYLKAVQLQLDEVGVRLSDEAVASLTEGVAAGESQAELKHRMLTLFSDTGSQLGPTRAERIAMTQATSAFNAGALAAARELTGPDRPLVKQWLTRNDERVRQAHRDTNGQLQLLDEPFDVGGTPMQFPGDPTAPADLVINCRCILRMSAVSTERTASVNGDDQESADTDTWQSRMPAQLKRYWLAGAGAAKIRWGTPGSFERCVRELRDEFPANTEGLCANLYHEATGRWPGQDKSGANVYTGAMVALMPHPEDAERLAIGGEPVDQLHLTLVDLGEAADWTEEQRLTFTQAVQRASGWLAPVQARAFGVAQWNPHGDSPVWVYNVDDDLDAEGSTLADVQAEIQHQTMDNRYELPRQHSPWAPHVAAVYAVDDFRGDMVERLGDVRFDRIRVAFAGEYTDFPLVANPPEEPGYLDETGGSYETEEAELMDVPPTVTWSTPGDTALAFENQQTGDSRIFAPGALYWDGGGPWPLQYADEMQGGHEGAELAGAINTISRDGDRIPGSGVLYLTQRAGAEAAMLLAQNAPLGVSVDLDDVDLEMVSGVPGAGVAPSYRARLLTASVLPVEGGGWILTGETVPSMSASGNGTVIGTRKVSVIVGADGRVPAEVLELTSAAGEHRTAAAGEHRTAAAGEHRTAAAGEHRTAAAGDPDMTDGLVLDVQKSGDFLMRITRGRVRGATLVTIPAYANARIVLDDATVFASATDAEVTAAIKSDTDYDRVLRHVRRSKSPVGAARLAQFLKMPVAAAQRLLALAASRGEVVRLTRGLYTDKTTSAKADHVMMDDLIASVTGAVDLPVADRDHVWDGEAAATRVFDWADGDTGKIARAFAYRDDDADPTTKRAYKLGYADVVDGTLRIIPKGVAAAIGAVNGARGGVDIPADELNDVRTHLESVRAHVAEETGEDEMSDIQASAWKAMQSMPAMPAEWFREPTIEELPPGGPGVNYSNGRIFGWVAQAGEPHAGFAKKITIDTLGRIDTSHFLRQRFHLDDGSTVKAGAYTMNVGHHRDGAECETSACQFDDTRTVAGIVTVGMNERGMWFSGAAAPWLSEWDRQVFSATQPSYHLKKSSSGGWQLRAVLGVPVPGHSSPLLASAVIERAQVALTAAATMAEADEAIRAEEERQSAEQAASGAHETPPAGYGMTDIDYDRLADAIVAAGFRAEQRKAEEAAELAELLAMAEELTAADKMDPDTTGIEGA